MSTSPIHGTIQIANKTAAEWTAQNPVLLAGQLGLETDTRKMKAGNGTAAWNSLSYTADTGAPGGALSSFTGTTRTLVAADNGNVVRCTNAAAVSVTIPSGLPAGFSCVIAQGGAGAVTVVAGAGVTLTAAPSLQTNGVESDLLIAPAGTDAYTCYSGGAPGGVLVSYTGTGRALLSSDNGNVVRCTNAGAVTMTLPSGLPTGFSCVLVQGGAGLVTLVAGAGVTLTDTPGHVTSGINTDILVEPAGVDSYVSRSAVAGVGATTMAALTDVNDFDLPTNNAPLATALAAIAATAGGVLVSVSGTRGTGNLLTATAASGWEGTVQWQHRSGGGSWASIGGATSLTYTEQIAYVADDIRALFAPTGYESNVLGSPSTLSSFSGFTDSWNDVADGTPPTNWTVNAGSPICYRSDTRGWWGPAAGVVPSISMRNAGGGNGTIEFPASANAGLGGIPASIYHAVVFRSNVGGTDYAFVELDAATRVWFYGEWDGASVTNRHNGSHTTPVDSTRWGIKVTINDANVTLEIDSGSGYVTDLTVTNAALKTGHYTQIGAFSGPGGFAAIGPVSYTP